MNWTMPGPGWLFCPGDRPERYEKAAAAADVVIIDLEDAVNPADKPSAREAIIANPQDVERTVIRVNAVDTDDFARDVEMLGRTSYRRVMLPKAESREQVERLADYDVIALIESPLGAVEVADITSAKNCVGVMWGSEDLTAGLGGRKSRLADGSYHPIVASVRAACLLAAKAHDAFALDSVYMDIPDLDGLGAESADAVNIGFDAKVAIHPKQVAVIRDAYRPSEAEVEWAQRLLEAAKSERGVFTFEGKMVDGPVFKQAQQIVNRAAVN